MKLLYPFFLSLLCVSCLNSQTENGTSNSGFALFKTSEKTHYFVDAKTGLVVYQKAFPSDWEVVSKPTYDLDKDFPSFLYAIQNQKGLKAFNTPIRQYIAFQNPQYAQMMRNYGMNNIKPVASLPSIVENEIKPIMNRDGFKFVSNREFPELMAYINQKKNEMGLNNIDIHMIATEWINEKNIKGITMVSQMVLSYGNSNGMTEPTTLWNYQTDFLFAPSNTYEAVLKTAITSTLKQKDSPNWQKYQAQVLNFRQQQQIAQHQQRMRNQQQQFEQHQQMMKERYAAQDANHERFMNSLRGTPTSTYSYTSDANHQNFIDMIREEQNVSLEGKTFKVEAGANNYWMNSDGKYIMSNDLFYNPNTDAIYDNQHWDLTTKQN
ncbi:MAG: hypothetical protein KDC68_06075 [Gelidibacter sp.]|nr:hypothetical protein [Gelidibacter sp.]